MSNLKAILYPIALASAVAACSQDTEVVQTEAAVESQAAAFSEFVAVLHPTDGNDVDGFVLFSNTDEGVRVAAQIRGLAPMSSHGFHIHEFGDCQAADASSAGGHFNPAGMPHGAPESEQRHDGDLGNLIANDAGVAQSNMVDSELSFSGPDSILGRAVVIHAGADDLESQPSGAAGPRVACGVIGVGS
ncbi:superoxide dismutase family protein [Pseudohongiella sp.]|uniref:Superoxide dismutase copper/zinc binding domain-containing protein n=1 Tax=marine sediment metagenome TaxID=412755 RepID=A0A0F9YJZ3_9ZZZZ|nr:superoxide dismutase family protein [Pseudohongiella sp.]HDZ07728.1 superoxide dismutase family protein [Pseudohongiella sp.]HEA63308.1 superoxide dismutase family protein [Pseudohongiella sp.]